MKCTSVSHPWRPDWTSCKTHGPSLWAHLCHHNPNQRHVRISLRTVGIAEWVETLPLAVKLPTHPPQNRTITTHTPLRLPRQDSIPTTLTTVVTPQENPADRGRTSSAPSTPLSRRSGQPTTSKRRFCRIKHIIWTIDPTDALLEPMVRYETSWSGWKSVKDHWCTDEEPIRGLEFLARCFMRQTSKDFSKPRLSCPTHFSHWLHEESVQN